MGREVGGMTRLIDFLAQIVNGIHDLIVAMAKSRGLTLTDKDLHFWIVGGIGIVLYAVTNVVFKRLARLSIEIISFIYTFTVLVVIVFALEIEQKITHRGDMEFQDIVFGLWGFILMFALYLAIVLIVMAVGKLIKKRKKR
jgi:hypothetical protein